MATCFREDSRVMRKVKNNRGLLEIIEELDDKGGKVI